MIFVDDMYKSNMGRFRGMNMSHMIAIDEKELHAMAKRIGVARHWYQGDHYDVCMSKRALAVKYGAIEVSMRELSAICWCVRNDWEFLTPAHAVELMLNKLRPRGKSKLGAIING